MTPGSCVFESRRRSESDAVASVRDSKDVSGRNLLVPIGLRRRGPIAFVAAPRRSLGYAFGAPLWSRTRGAAIMSASLHQRPSSASRISAFSGRCR